MAAVTVTNTTIAANNTAQTFTKNPSANAVVDSADVFTITLTRADAKAVILIDNPTAGQGSINYSIAPGTYWAAPTSAKTGAVTNATSVAIELEGAKYENNLKQIVITLTPASGKRLLTDHAASIEVIEVY